MRVFFNCSGLSFLEHRTKAKKKKSNSLAALQHLNIQIKLKQYELHFLKEEGDIDLLNFHMCMIG